MLSGYDLRLYRRAKRADLKGDILISGDTIEDVRHRGRLMKSAGLIKRCCILRSEVTGELYQWWGRPMAPADQREYWRRKQQEHRAKSKSE